MDCPTDYSNGLSGGLFQWTVRRTSLSGRTISGMVIGPSPENCTNFPQKNLQFSGAKSAPESAGVRRSPTGQCGGL